ncbi:MAG: sulfotransferase domain-containing protein [Chloroflexia bacterium]|nr:sulfotransferase domain-containing protein [Chloroflexia bacterium]MDQ3410933.1 sulfotransferase [Chloroflexota bacterium]
MSRVTDVVLTGVPRSGTTLTCALLNKLPDTVALHEPMQGMDHGDPTDPRDVSGRVERFFDEQRASLLTGGRALSRNIDGVVPDNPFGDELSAKGVRRQLDSQGEILVDKELSADFTLVIKHTHLFAWMLESLVDTFPIYAIVRNPLATVASWRSVSTRIRSGHSPAERAVPELKAKMDLLDDDLDRQLCLLGWFWDQFTRHLPERSIIRYEDLIATNGRALSVIRPEAERFDEPLENRNSNRLYDLGEMQQIGKRLLQSDGAYWTWYPKESVGTLLNELDR